MHFAPDCNYSGVREPAIEFDTLLLVSGPLSLLIDILFKDLKQQNHSVRDYFEDLRHYGDQQVYLPAKILFDVKHPRYLSSSSSMTFFMWIAVGV